MKVYLLFILLICTTLQAQNNFQSTVNQIDYFKSNPNDLKVENRNYYLSSNDFDSLTLHGGFNFGRSVSTAGDVNGDGYSDVIVGSNRKASIFFGEMNMDKIEDINLDSAKIVSTAGDVNGDGYSDVIVSGCYRRAYIFYGGLNMDSIPDVIIEIDEYYFGTNGQIISVSTAGDVNGDGYSDVILGVASMMGYGFALIYYGGISMDSEIDVGFGGDERYDNFGFSVSTAGDVNGDGFSDVIAGAYSLYTNMGKVKICFGGINMDGNPDVTIYGEAPGNGLGFSVSTAGDVNGDGYADVIVGGTASPPSIARANIYYGGFLMDNIADVIFTSESISTNGRSVSSAGDVNGDGYSDVIIGDDISTNIFGLANVYYGGPLMDNIKDLTFEGATLNSSFGGSVSSAGDFNGDGLSDLLIGSIGNNNAYMYFNFVPNPPLINPVNRSILNPTSINFKWEKLNSSIFYILIVSTDSTFNNIIVIDTIYLDTSKLIIGFQNGTKYFWRLKTKDTSGVTFKSSIWSFTTTPLINLTINLLSEGMYSQAFNQWIRNDSITAYLYQSIPPFSILDSAKSKVDSISFSSLFKFFNSNSGTYYITVRHLNSIETWSKYGGELLLGDGTINNYDFTNANTQAYGNNLKLKGTKYCLYSGDVNQDGFINLFDVIKIYNDAANFVTGRFLKTDLTGDNIVDLTDVTLGYNNSANFVSKITP